MVSSESRILPSEFEVSNLVPIFPENLSENLFSKVAYTPDIFSL